MKALLTTLSAVFKNNSFTTNLQQREHLMSKLEQTIEGKHE